MSVGLEPRAGGARERGTPPGDGSRRKVAERLAVLGQREIIRRARVHGMGSNAVAGRGADCRDWNIGWKAELLDEGGQLGLAATRRNEDHRDAWGRWRVPLGPPIGECDVQLLRLHWPELR